MTVTDFIREKILQHGSGIFLSTLLADILTLVILVCLITMLVYPAAKNMIELRAMANQVGGPKSHWFWGDVKQYGFTHEGLFNSLKRTYDFPAMCTYYVSFHCIVMVYHPDVIKTVISRSVPKAMVYKKFLSPLLREGLVTSDGEVWKRHRRLLTSIFHFDILKEYCQVFEKNCHTLLKGFDTIARSETAGDVVPTLSTTTYVNMMECVMSQLAINDLGQETDFVRDVRDASFLCMERQQNVFYWNEVIYKRTASGKKLKKVQEKLFEKVNQIIEERRALLFSINKNLNLKSEISKITDEALGKTFTFRKRKGKAMDFLDLLLQTKDQEGIGLTNDEIIDEVLTFFAAGMETVATASTWTCYTLATHQQEQAKCREEIIRICGENDDITMSDLSQLSYLTQCIKESMRLFPPIPTLGRQLAKDTVFSHRFNNHQEITLKKGLNIGISIFALHRNPYVWKNPEIFDPERFSSENSSDMSPYAFIPFGAGPRNCIGQQFAMMELKVIIANILRNFELSWDRNISAPVMNPGVANPPKDGLQLLVKRLK